MKFKTIVTTLFVFIIFLFTLSCKSKNLPKVSNPEYQSYSFDGERGYKVKFELNHDSIPASAVVINKIKQNISEDSKSGLKYDVNVIAQSTRIFGFKPQIIESPDGIFFKTDTVDVFKEVDFMLKNK